MNPLLIPYKFKSIKAISALSEKQLVSLGWKCRKYIKWDQVHVENDRDILKCFGDSAVDGQLIEKELLGRIYEILLNVQRWRLDKEALSVEPPHEPSWDRINTILSLAQENPQIIIKYMREHVSGLEALNPDDIYPTFIKQALIEILAEVNNLDPLDLSAELLSRSLEDVINRLGLASNALDEIQGVLLSMREDEIAEALGFDISGVMSDFESLGEDIDNTTPIVSFMQRALPPSTLFELSESQQNQIIYLNTNHNVIKFSDKNSEIRAFLERFLLSYVRAMGQSRQFEKELGDFSSYLALELQREFRAENPK